MIELVVVAIIVGLLALVAVPNMIIGVNRGYAKDARNNLIAIYAAQQNYSQDHNGGYLDCGNIACINTGLGLNIISNDGLQYTCIAANYICEATKPSYTMRVYLNMKLWSKNNVPIWYNTITSDPDNPVCQNYGSHPPGGPCP